MPATSGGNAHPIPLHFNSAIAASDTFRQDEIRKIISQASFTVAAITCANSWGIGPKFEHSPYLFVMGAALGVVYAEKGRKYSPQEIALCRSIRDMHQALRACIGTGDVMTRQLGDTSGTYHFLQGETEILHAQKDPEGRYRINNVVETITSVQIAQMIYSLMFDTGLIKSQTSFIVGETDDRLVALFDDVRTELRSTGSCRVSKIVMEGENVVGDGGDTPHYESGDIYYTFSLLQS